MGLQALDGLLKIRLAHDVVAIEECFAFCALTKPSPRDRGFRPGPYCARRYG
jgi:hypothetical protein